MTPEHKLSALFAGETPPARDYAFQARVAEAIARRRAWMTVAALAPWTVAAAVLLWALIPVAGPMAESLGPALQPALTILVGSALVVAAALWLSRRLQRGLRRRFSAV